MGRELYVGNLPYEADEYEIRRLFAVAGKVSSLHLITDPVSGKFKGCCYLKMSTVGEAKEAIASLDGALFINRLITVSEARPQKPTERSAGGAPGKRTAGAGLNKGRKKPATDGPENRPAPESGKSRNPGSPGTRPQRKTRRHE
jgi:RNA recognition motif-containing protein